MSDWCSRLIAASQAKCPGVVLRFNTSDRVFAETDASRAMSLPFFLAKTFHSRGYVCARFTLSAGVERLHDPDAERVDHDVDHLAGTDNPHETMCHLSGILRRKTENPLLLIVDYAEHLIPNYGQMGIAGLSEQQVRLLEQIHQWAVDDGIRHSGNFVVMIERGCTVNPLLHKQGRFLSINIPLPDSAQREAFARMLIDGWDGSTNTALAPELSLERLANATSGLRLSDLEFIVRHAQSNSMPVTLDMVNQRKAATVDELCNGLLEVVEPNTGGFDAVAGCLHAKSYFQAIKPLWTTGDPSLPSAVLLAGVPGTGKSFLVRAVAHEFDIPCLAMRSVREKWVGQSERNLETILTTLDSMAPCILWTDEIDQTLGGDRDQQSGGDSGTSDRMLGRIQEYFGGADRRGKILWIATTNRPDRLDIAIKDRFPVRIPFLHPTAMERKELLPVLFQQLGRQLGGDIDNVLADSRLDTMSARSIIETISLAGLLADSRSGGSHTSIDVSSFEAALAEVRVPAGFEAVLRTALTALAMTTYRCHLPWKAMGSAGARDVGWPVYLDPYVDSKTGNLLDEKINAEIGDR